MDAAVETVEVASAEAAADAAWSAIIAGPASTPPETVVPPASNAPETPAQSVPQEAVGTNPKVDAVEPATPPEPTGYDKWLAQHGGDKAKADQAIWDTNNRAAEAARKADALARENEELKAKIPQSVVSNTAEPAVVEPTAPTPTPVVEPAPEQVQQWISHQVAQDRDCNTWVAEWTSNRDTLAALHNPASPDSIPAIAAEVQTLKAWLKLPQIANDEYQKNEFSSKLELAETRHERLLIKSDRLTTQNERLDSQFTARANQYRAHISDHYQTQARAAQAQQETQTTITRHATELKTAWDPAVTRTIEKFKIPESEVAEFKADLKTIALANLEAGIKVEDLDSFMGKEAERLNARFDKRMRAQFAEYGKQATQRASNPAPAPSVDPQVQPNSTDPMKAVYANEDAAWARLTG